MKKPSLAPLGALEGNGSCCDVKYILSRLFTSWRHDGGLEVFLFRWTGEGHVGVD